MFLYTTMTNSSATVTTEDGGRQNMFASEPRIEVMEIDVHGYCMQNKEYLEKMDEDEDW